MYFCSQINLKLINMSTFFFRTLLLSSITLFVISCGSEGGSFSSGSVMNQDSLLTIQAGRLMTIQNAIEINGKALEKPFQSAQTESNGQPIPVNPLEDFSEERLMAFKEGFNKVRKGLDGVQGEHQLIIDEVVLLQKLLLDAQTELNADGMTAETKSAFGRVPDQIKSLQIKIDALEANVIDAQKEAINLLMSEEALQSGASWLMVNSPLI